MVGTELMGLSFGDVRIMGVLQSFQIQSEYIERTALISGLESPG